MMPSRSSKRAVATRALVAALALSTAAPALTASAHTATSVRAPAAPRDLTALGGFRLAHLTWGAVKGASSYRVYVATSASGAWTRVATKSPLTEPQLDVAGLTNGTPVHLSARRSAAASSPGAPPRSP
ncbi:MAG: hypothetical protein JWO76_2042 [Nocardioides sp.]|nr:hypothetical protein [Nocardioides sp.]